MKNLTDPDGGFFSRRGLSRTRYAFQDERPGGAIFYLGLFVVFASTSMVPMWARIVDAILAFLTLLAFVFWSFHSARVILKAYRLDLDEKRERVARDVMDS